MLYILTPIFCVSLLGGAVFSFSEITTASALTNTANAIKAGNLDDLWDSTNNIFKGSVLEDLEEKLFGDDDPVEFIKANDTEFSTTGSYVVPASSSTDSTGAKKIGINEKVGDTTNGLVLKLGGMDWMAASLTLADVNGTTDNVILTLYLANPYKTISPFYNSESSAKGNNMYSASTIRSNLLTWSDLKLFSDDTAGSFASNYLIKPKNINYQQTQTLTGRTSPSNDCPNEALGTVSNWPSGINYQPADEIRGYRYDAWGEDYIWLPSLTEAGTNNIANTECIWKLSSEQRKFIGGNGYAYFRSGQTNYQYVSMMASDGKSNASVTTNRGVRPAIHLNLTAAAANSNGGTIKNTSADTTAKTYQNAAYTFSVNGIKPDKMDVTYSANITDWNAATRSFTATDVGEYKVTVALKSSIVSLGRQWASGGTANAEYTFKIEKATPDVTATLKASGDLYTTQGMPPLILSTDTAAITAANAAGKPYVLVTANCEGTVSWVNDPKPSATPSNYDYTFTPTGAKASNYTGAVTKSIPLTFNVPQLNDIEVVSNGNTKTIYTKYDATRLRQWFTVNAVYSSGDKDPTPNYTIVLPTGGLVAGSNVLTFRYDDGTNKKTKQFTINGVVLSEVVRLDVFPDFTGVTIYSSAKADDLKKYLDVEAVWNSDDSETIAATDYTVVIPTGGLVAPDTYVKVTYNGKDSANFAVPVTAVALDSISVDSFSVTGDIYPTSTAADLQANITVVLKGTNNDGSAYTGDLTGYTLAPAADYASTGKVVVTCQGKTATFNATLGTVALDTITVDSVSYSGDIYPTSTAADLQANITVVLKGTNNDGSAFTGDLTGYTLAPAADYATTGNVVVTCQGKTVTFAATVTPVAVKSMTTKYKLPDGATLDASKGLDDLKGGLEVVVEYNNGAKITLAAEGYTLEAEAGGLFNGGKLTAGTHTITAKFVDGDGNPHTQTFSVTVEKATIDMSGITFVGDTLTDDGQPHKIEVVNLPNGVTVEYEYVDESGNTVKTSTPPEFTAAGVYTVKAHFKPIDGANYKDIASQEVTLTITDAVVSGVSVVVEDGAKFTTANTLDDLKAKIKAEVEYNNGTKEAVAADNLTLTCDTLRDGGKFEIGAQTVTITYNDGTNDFTTTVTVTVAKAKVALPVYDGTLSYTGLELKPTANDFDGYNADIMTFNETKTIAGLNAGAYKAVFALKDSDRYEWATTTSLKKSVFAVTVFDGEISIDPTFEAAVDWNIAKAKISATKAEGELPVFASESYAGAISDVVTFRYFADAECTQEVAADKLERLHDYYVVAEIADEVKDNFELELSASKFTKPFSYTTPEGELTFWEKVVKFMTAERMGLVVWLWIVIAVVALILLITIIALAAKSRKKKRIREEQRLAEEKAERLAREERDREERRLEREERMARMSQQQAMPQMMMPQMMPQIPQQQYSPQSQPMSTGGGASSNEIAELKAEITALRAEQSLRDISELKAEQQVTQTKIDLQLANILSRLGGEQIVQGGISMDKLTELIRTEVHNALDGREKSAQSANATTDVGAAPVTAQVPPDAVMTTVTTTKIDTTKKTAQGTHDTAQAARPTRSFVPPMPVDDGRVFDVGGFYKPADPATDFNFDEEDKKD